MSDKNFICPRCLVQGLSNGPNELTDIAFDMPAEILNEIKEKLSLLPDAVAELGKSLGDCDRFKCITMEEMDEYLEVLEERTLSKRGILRLDGQWLLNKMRDCGLDVESIGSLENEEIYSGQWKFIFTRSGADLIPRGMMPHHTMVVLGRRCKKCGQILFPDTGTAPELRILLQGNSRAGKTSCIISIIWWLERLSKIKKSSGISRDSIEEIRDFGGAVDDNMKDHRYRWLYNELVKYENGYKVNKTPTDQREAGLISLKIYMNDKELVLTFLDMPGEFFEDKTGEEDHLVTQYTKVYQHVDAVFTCIQHEVLAMDQIKLDPERVHRAEVNTGYAQKQMEVIQGRYGLRIRQFNDYLRTEDIPFPYHAIILTKTDSIEVEPDTRQEKHVFAEESKLDDCMLEQLGGHEVILDEKEFCKHAIGVREFAHSQADAMCGRLEALSEANCYFAESAYGHPAVMNEHDAANPPAPYQIHLPLLWILALKNYVPIRYKASIVKPLSWLQRVMRIETPTELYQEEKTKYYKKAGPEARENLLGGQKRYMTHKIVKGGH